jgi:hypothetical protein
VKVLEEERSGAADTLGRVRFMVRRAVGGRVDTTVLWKERGGLKTMMSERAKPAAMCQAKGLTGLLKI